MKQIKLIRYNSENTVTRVYTPQIRIYGKGNISLNSAFVNEIKLKEGDRIEFLQDEEKTLDWYIVKSKKGFLLRNQATTKGLQTSSRQVAHKFLQSVEMFGKKSVKCVISTEPTKFEDFNDEPLYAIITKSISV